MNNETNEKKISHGLKLAMIRAGAALLAAVLLLLGTGLSAFTLIKGADEPKTLLEVEEGAFVKRDVYAILGFFGEEIKGSDKVTARYGIIPVDGKLATVRFSSRYLESAMAVQNSTYDFVNGKAESLDKYVSVQGTLTELSEDQSALLYDWFGLNKEQLVTMKLISDTDDYADYLADTVILVDTVNYKSQNLVIAMSILAALCLVYFATELVLMAVGFYRPGKGKKDECLCECLCDEEGCDCDCDKDDDDCSAEGCEDSGDDCSAEGCEDCGDDCSAEGCEDSEEALSKDENEEKPEDKE